MEYPIFLCVYLLIPQGIIIVLEGIVGSEPMKFYQMGN